MTTINSGTLVVTEDGALGPADAAGIVVTGGPLALPATWTTPPLEPITHQRPGFDGTGAIVNISWRQYLRRDITLDGSATIGADAGLLTLDGTIDLGVLFSLTVTGSGNTTINGVIRERRYPLAPCRISSLGEAMPCSMNSMRPMPPVSLPILSPPHPERPVLSRTVGRHQWQRQ